MSPSGIPRIRILRKKKLLMLLEQGQDPTSKICTQCGKDAEPETVIDLTHNITWVVRFCMHCGHRAVMRLPVIPDQAAPVD